MVRRILAQFKELGPVCLPKFYRHHDCRGRNVEGQCGVETSVIVATPTPVIELQGAPVCALKAGKLNSAAILHGGPHCEGEAWTWGCGKAGKLGQGSSHPVHEPSRVRT